MIRKLFILLAVSVTVYGLSSPYYPESTFQGKFKEFSRLQPLSFSNENSMYNLPVSVNWDDIRLHSPQPSEETYFIPMSSKRSVKAILLDTLDFVSTDDPGDIRGEQLITAKGAKTAAVNGMRHSGKK